MRAITFAAAVLLSSAALANLKVMATTPDLASIVKSIGGSNVSVTTIVVGARDPHFVEAKPSYMSKASSTDLFVAIGLELEVGYEQQILSGSGNRKIAVGAPGHVYASQWAHIIDKPAGPVNRSMGDVHPYGNPHFMLDPYNGRLVAIGLAGRMGELDPKNKDTYAENMRKFVNQLDTEMFGQALFAKYGGPKLWDWQRAGQLDEKLKAEGTLGQLGGWAGQMLPFEGKPIITYHRTWGYFANRFRLKVVDELEPKPGLEPTPGHLAAVIKSGQSNGVKVIMHEHFYPRRHAEFVASRIGAKHLVLPINVGHEPVVKDYISLFDTIVSRLSAALR